MCSPFYTVLLSGSIFRFTPTTAPLPHRRLLHHPLPGAACRFGGAHIRASNALTFMIAGDHPRTPPLSTSSQLPVPLVHDVPRAPDSSMSRWAAYLVSSSTHLGRAPAPPLACLRTSSMAAPMPVCRAAPGGRPWARAELNVNHDDILWTARHSDAHGSESEGRGTTISAAHDPRALRPKEPWPVPIHIPDELQVSHEIDALPATRRERGWHPRSKAPTFSFYNLVYKV
ncbi:hypothetical protein B0H14DRAFT_3449868 [Mycena olivaceomarginata]|nr:hypothetical protein B0H14DRAFT_3449868 [Mycena olivaceomarginata]